MIPLTPKQRKGLDTIKALSRGGVAPSFREIQNAMGLKSTGGVHRLLAALKERGHVTYEPGRARTIEVFEPTPDLSKLSLSGLRNLIVNAQAEIDVRLNGRHR